MSFSKTGQRSGIKYADPWYTMIQRVRATARDVGIGSVLRKGSEPKDLSPVDTFAAVFWFVLLLYFVVVVFWFVFLVLFVTENSSPGCE